MESKFIDGEKDRLANEHDIEVIRIDCDYYTIDTRFEYIKQNILENKELNKLFDLSKMNWEKCNEFALSNLVKIACEYKKNNPKLTTTEIGKIMGGYNKAIICRWLKQGDGIWCDYNSKGKQVEIFENKISLGIFPSASELDRQSKKLFGIHLDFRGISNSCLKEKVYKGYTFKYVY